MLLILKRHDVLKKFSKYERYLRADPVSETQARRVAVQSRAALLVDGTCTRRHLPSQDRGVDPGDHSLAQILAVNVSYI